jgi:hypothetical protein
MQPNQPNQQQQRDPRMNPFQQQHQQAGPFNSGGGASGLPGAAGLMGGFGNLFQNNPDPSIVENQVIPLIIHQARESFNSGSMSQEQFSDVMRNVMLLKEQTMMAKADREEDKITKFENIQISINSFLNLYQV